MPHIGSAKRIDVIYRIDLAQPAAVPAAGHWQPIRPDCAFAVTTPLLRSLPARTPHQVLATVAADALVGGASAASGATLAETRVGLPDAREWGHLFAEPSLPAGEAELLNRLVRPRRVAAGQMVFRQGDAAVTLVALLQGNAALGRTDAQGQFRHERHLQGPAWLDAGSAWLGTAHAHDARALDELVVLEFDAEALGAALEQQPSLARQLVRVLASEVRSLTRHAQALMHLDAPARWAGWLLSHCQPVPEQPQRGVVQLALRKRDIASQLAITPETLSRLMRSFSAQGVISVAGYTVHVLDRNRLALLADG